MQHSIFFHDGYAIHGSYEINRLGGPASHGCIRLHPANAATLFALVKSGGTLAVKDGEQVIPVINRIATGFENVVMTQDWHTPHHMSFASAHGKSRSKRSRSPTAIK
jgi:nicotinamidase-related amidase